MRRTAILLYGIIAYASFVVAILYLVGFIGNLVVPKSIDHPTVGDGTFKMGDALVNLGLIFLFGLQHSLMARRGFKRRLARYLPQPMERATFVLATSVVFGVLFLFWRPMVGTIWEFNHPAVEIGFLALFFTGWLIAFLSTFSIDHFDLFGLRQVILEWRRRSYTGVQFSRSGLYRFIRHPINFGFLIAVWSTAHMTIGHLIFSVGMTLYIFLATILEEGDLVAAHGEVYTEYQKEVPMLFPTRSTKS